MSAVAAKLNDADSPPRYGSGWTKLVANGYVPIPVKPVSKAPAPPDWRNFTADAESADRYRNHGVGLILGVGGLHAIDCDFMNPAAADLVARSVAGRLRGQGTVLIRQGQKPKVAFLFRDADGEGHKKSTGTEFKSDEPEGKGQKVEILGAGQQIVVFGIHPVTGQEYVWAKSGSPLEVPLDQLPTLTRVEVVALVAEIDAAVLALGLVPKDGTPKLSADNAGSSRNAALMANVDGEKAIDSPERLESLAMFLANATNGFEDYDQWINPFGLGCKAASIHFPEEGERIFHAASAISDRYSFEEAAEKWKSFNPHSIGVGTLIKWGRDLGWSDPARTAPPTVNVCLPAVLTVNPETKAAHGTLSNAAILVNEYCAKAGLTLWHDKFEERDCITDAAGRVREIDNALGLQIAAAITSDAKYRAINLTLVEAAITLLAQRNQRDPALEWLDTLKWDGIGRLSLLFVRGFGAADSKFNSQAGINLVVAMAARQYRPGVKADAMPVIEGPQGVGKSTALRALAGDHYFSDSLPSMDSPEFSRALRGKMLFEIPELSAMRRADIENIKAVLSRQEDRYRDAYKRREQSHPRRCCFAGAYSGPT